jgi:methionyl-tRNA synthetase
MVMSENIDINEFKKLDIRVGTVVQVENIKGAKRLYRVQVDLGELGIRQTISGLAEVYKADELLGKKVVFLVNLKPAKIMGETSEGMLLAAEKDAIVSLLSIDREISNGSKIH